MGYILCGLAAQLTLENSLRPDRLIHCGALLGLLTPAAGWLLHKGLCRVIPAIARLAAKARGRDSRVDELSLGEWLIGPAHLLALAVMAAFSAGLAYWLANRS